MSQQRRSNLVIGLLLILAGIWFLAVRLVPRLEDWFYDTVSWPLLIVAVGFFLLIFGLLLRAPGMAVPACIVGNLGQESTAVPSFNHINAVFAEFKFINRAYSF